MNLQEIRDDIDKLGADMKAILDGVTADKRKALNPDEETKFDRMDTDREALLRTAKRLEKEEALAAGTGRQTPAAPPENRQRTPAPNRGRANHLEALRSWFLAGSSKRITAEQRANASQLGVDLSQSEVIIKLPSQALRSSHPDEIRQWEERAQSVNADGSPGGGGEEGGYLVADEAMRPLEIALLAFGGMRQGATVFRTNTGADLPWPTTNDTSNKGALLAENGTHTELPVSFSQLVLEAYKYTSRLLLVSVELLQDSNENIAQILGRLLGERIGRITNEHFTTGDGSNKPNGIVTAATLGVTGSLGASITYDELVNLEHSVDPAYRTGAKFMFHDTTLAILKKLKDGDLRPMWLPGLATREPDTILGHPYIINQDMPQMGPGSPSGGDKSILFGAIDKYMIRDVREITLRRLDERYAELGQVGFLAFSRHDGDLLDAGTNPVKYFINA